MSIRSILCWSSLLFLLLSPACSETDPASFLTDGDKEGESTEAPVVNIGDPCTTQADCTEGLSCVPIQGSFICSMTCNSHQECLGTPAYACCTPIGNNSFCGPSSLCGFEDGDDADGDLPPDGDPDLPPADADPEGESCVVDSLHCVDLHSVERCNSDGEWVPYRTCSKDSYCVGGNCVSADGDVTCNPDEMGEGVVCCPDTYRCYINDIQRCKGDGSDWEYYKTCESAEMCLEGRCVDLMPDGDADGSADGDGEGAENVCEICTAEEGCEGYQRYCFVKKNEETGCCWTNCTQPGGRCPEGYSCNESDGQCEAMEGYCCSDAQCGSNQFCMKRAGRDCGSCQSYCFNQGQWCASTEKCVEDPTDPNYGRCVPRMQCSACSSDLDCEVGDYCNIFIGQSTGCCIPMCGSANPCQGGMECCSDGRCGYNCGVPKCDLQCPSCHVCDPLYQACALQCPPCPEGSFCDQESCPRCKEGPCTNPLICGWGLRQCCFGYSCSAIIYGVIGFCI